MNLSSQDFTFARFLVGTFSCLFLCIFKRNFSPPRNILSLLVRAATNYGAVWSFFRCVQLGDPSLANVLNLTYPVFGALWGIAILNEKNGLYKLFLSSLSFIGIMFAIQPGSEHFSWLVVGWGLLSGVLAAISVQSLSRAREFNDTETVLAAMFGGGLLLSLLFDGSPNLSHFSQSPSPLLISALLGVLGQYLITFGAPWVSSVEIGIISTLRILFALIIGSVFMLDQDSGIGRWIGGLLVLGSNIGLATLYIKAAATQQR